MTCEGNVLLKRACRAYTYCCAFISLLVLKRAGSGCPQRCQLIIIAIFIYGMPTDKALWSFGYGAFYGLWPIAWIIIAAIFLYKLTVKSGYFDILRESIIAITPDQRIQVILYRILLWRVFGRGDWLWRTCGNYRCAARGAWASPTLCSWALPYSQYCASGIGVRRCANHCDGRAVHVAI